MTKLHRISYTVLWIMSVIVVVLLVHGLTENVREAEHKADRSAAATKEASEAVTDLAEQVRSLGGQPVVEPSDLPQVGPQGDVGPQGLTGATGATGPQGPRGLKGATGPAGAAGAKGEPGPAGRDGKDGTDGADGADGAVGPAGYPTSFTFTWLGGQEFTCTDSDGDHAYTCTTP
jgi:hypothetical protein